ncbi:SusC/RagA family TonB-linked outer membrane protein [Flavobacterium marginilacus]|uniref:SusC/RagA family TonB-linked outer membrane protein n=1 Tax=Flavobacterium marginilacus TaxID=3003256 RepID=UPI00248E3109|nr:SusC/RagA family TonB-linked outer membrane protein [Flavobacterium marginilacus]
MRKIFLIVMVIFTAQVTLAQTKKINGFVSDASGTPISGANVNVKGETNGASTDFDGKFTLDVKPGATLIISYLGYDTRNVEVGESSTIDVKLNAASSTALTEVVVTSLGIKKSKKSLTYSAQELKGEDLVRAKDPNLMNTIAGKIAGVAVTKSAGGTGGSTKVTIRGNSSTTNNNPLYVVDGVPMLNISSFQPNDSFGNTQGGNRDGGDVIGLLNPDDFEGMTVLKGASATALYGSQGARGVVLLTSKKAKEGISAFRVSSNTTVETAAYLPKFQTSYIAKPGADESWGAAKSTPDHTRDFFETGLTQISSFGFSTGSQNSATNISYANTSANGIIPTNSLSKNNFSIRQMGKFFGDRLTVNANANYTSQYVTNRPTSGLYFNPLTGLYLMPRGYDFNEYKNNFEKFDPARNMMVQNWMTNRDIEQNPYWGLNRNKSVDGNQLMNGSVGLNYKVNNWLSVGSRYNYDRVTSQFDKEIYASTQGTLSHANGRYISIDDVSTQNYGDLIATINTKINNDITFFANVGTSFTKTSINDETVLDSDPSGLGITNWFTLHNFNSNTGNYQNYGYRREQQSVFAAATFGYKNMLYVDVTGRNDWSSTLANTGNLSFFYPSVGTTAILSEMFKMPEAISFGKVRASFAQVGNDVPAFYTSPTSQYNAANPQNINPTVGPRPGTNLKPESQNSFELGTEWRFVNNRFGIELTYYNNKTKDQLLTIPAPATNAEGYQNYAYNGGVIENNGIEALLNAKIVDNDKFKWDATLNYSKNNNKVSGLPEELGGTVVLTQPGVNSYRYSLINGRPFGVIEGINLKRDDQGRILLNADGSIQKTGFEEVGNANPDYMLGLTNSFKYGNYFLNFTIDGRFGGDVMSLTEAVNDKFGVSKVTGDARAAGGVDINAVYAPGTPNAGQAYSGKYSAESYYSQVGGREGATGEYIYNATNVSLRELALGYTFDLKNNKIFKTANLSLVGRNLFFFYKDAPFDPNISLSTGNGLQGIDVYAAPSTRSIGLNLNVTF